MAETPVKVIVDLSKPKGQREQIVPLTADEIAEREVMAAQAAEEQAAREAEEQAKADAKAAANAKLEALGLTADEIAAITGA